MLLCPGWNSVCLSFFSGFVTMVLPSIQTRPKSYYSAPHSELRLFHPSPPLALTALQFPFPAISKSSASSWTTHYPSQPRLLPFQIMLLSYPCSPLHSSVNQRRRLQDDCMLNSNSSTWPNQYLSNSPKPALAAYQTEEQLQGCYTDIQSP